MTTQASLDAMMAGVSRTLKQLAASGMLESTQRVLEHLDFSAALEARRQLERVDISAAIEARRQVIEYLAASGTLETVQRTVEELTVVTSTAESSARNLEENLAMLVPRS